MTDRAQWTVHGLVALATAVVFVIDLQTSWGVATWILYALPMFLLCYGSGVGYLYPFAALVSALIVLDHFLSAPLAPLLFSVFNRTAGLVTLWIAAWLLVQRESKSLALRHLAESLEAKVAERTESLQAANIALRQAEEHCRRGKAHLHALLDHSSDLIIEYDENMRVRYASPSAKRLLGYEPERMLGRPGLELIHPEDAAAVGAAIQRVLANAGSVESVEHRVRHRNGTWRWFDSVGSNQPGGPGIRGVVANSRDITERKESERLRVEALERQRDALLREVHHRIKNILQGVVGLLQQHARERPEIAEPMRAAIARVDSVAAVHGLHAVGGDGAVYLCDVVDAIGEYQRKLSPEVELRIERPGDWREMRLDDREAVAVALIVNELVLNAIKSCLREHCKVPVRIAFARDAAAVRVTVSNAVGRLPEGFDFAAARGLGTGLTLVKSLLPPEGARFTIRQLEPQGAEAELRLAHPVITKR